MSLLEAIFFGIIQGLGEFLPISSSGHLAIAQSIFGFDNPDRMITFTVLLHLGTLAAVVAVYYRDIWDLILGFFSMLGKLFTGKLKQGLAPNERFALYIILATLPLAAAAVLSAKVEQLYAYTLLAGVLLIVNGFILLLSDRIRRGKLAIENLKPHNALLIGLCQLVAVLPGISRSGSTISGGLLNGLDRPQAVRFSFIMSIPAILGANIFKLKDMLSDPIPSSDAAAYIVGALTAAVFGFAAIKLLTYITRKHSFGGFAVYCWAVGLATVIYELVK